MSIARYSREVHFDDLNNVHTFAVLAVPPGSRVLDLGAADGSVARVLAARGCDVTAVERDPDGVRALAAAGLRAVQADLDHDADLGLPSGAYDVVLLLDVLEHLVDPAAVLARATRWLAPGGRVMLSVPHVAHAAVRLSLLQGRFPRTDIGLLDRTHLHFFDREQVEALLTGAGLSALDTLTVVRDLHETELAIDPSSLAPEVLAAATSDPLARVYQFFIVAQPGAVAVAGGGLLQHLLTRLQSVAASHRTLEARARQLEAERLALQVQIERRSRQGEAGVRATEAPAPPRGPSHVTADLVADLEADRDQLRQQLIDRMEALRDASEAIAALQREVQVQRAFAQRMGATLPPAIGRVPTAALTPDGAGDLPNDALIALAAEVAEYRRAPYAATFAVVRRVDTWLLGLPRLRRGIKAAARLVARARAGV